MRRKESKQELLFEDEVSGNLIPLVSFTVPKELQDRLSPGDRIRGAVFGKYPSEDVLKGRKVEDCQALYGKDITTVTPLSKEAHLFLKEAVDEVLALLPYRERLVLELRFGLDDGRSRTLVETGKIVGLEIRGKPYSKERTRQLEAKAIRGMRHPTQQKRLEDYTK
ncbi:hypothetical protein HYU95_02190 [Candidatus Daviesbacteria bacterium]|nr:hypothetical protein [Candidatus Daviesbacteria bacterium]